MVQDARNEQFDFPSRARLMGTRKVRKKETREQKQMEQKDGTGGRRTAQIQIEGCLQQCSRRSSRDPCLE
jgi:hypothetical protein